MFVKGKIFVPWVDDFEWETVRNQILSSNIEDMVRGCETILMWKLKNFPLPAYVESTLCLLQVKIKKEKLTDLNNIGLSMIEEYNLRLAYSTALMRFVNHVSSISGGKNESLYSSAKTQNIPDWIINIRHEAAHSQDLPTLDALCTAHDRSFEWLLNTYWKKKRKVDQNQMEAKGTIQSYDESENGEVTFVLKKAFHIWYNLQKNKIPLKEMKPDLIFSIEEFINLKNKHFNHIKLNGELKIKHYFNNSKSANCSSPEEVQTGALNSGVMKSMLLNFFQTVAKDKNHRNSFLTALLSSSFITENASIRVSKWQKLFEIIEKFKLFEELIRKLFIMAGDGNEGASKWLVILYNPIKLLRKKWSTFKIMKKQYKKSDLGKIKQELVVKYAALNGHSTIALNVFRPPIISLDMLTGVLLNPETPHLKELFKYLKFVRPPLPRPTVELIKKLVFVQDLTENYKMEENDNERSDKIFTIDDLPSFAHDNIESLAEIERDICDETGGGGWRKSEIDGRAWNKCPLGLLPFQTRVNCDLPDDLEWAVEIVNPDNTIVRKSLKSFTEAADFGLN